MGHELRYILETKRLVWLVAVVFAVVIMFQYFEFPYGDVVSSLFSASMGQTPENGSHPPEGSQIPKILGNITHFGGSNYTGPSNVLDKANRTINKGLGLDSESERKGGSDEFSKTDVDGVSGDQGSSKQAKHDLMPYEVKGNDSLAPEKASDPDGGSSIDNVTNCCLEENISDAEPPVPMIVVPSTSSPAPSNLPTIVNTTLSAPIIVLDHNKSTPHRDASNSAHHFEEPGTSHTNLVASANESSPTEVPLVKESQKPPMGEVVSISEMHDILVYNRASYRSMKPRWSAKVDQELLEAKLQIENAPFSENDRTLYPALYRNVSRFKRSYELMERILKVYIYKEGEKPIFHQPQAVLTGIYASEGWFMKHMKGSKHFVTKDSKQAHLFYLPFSSRMLEETLYVPDSHSHRNLVQHLKNYLDLIVGRYTFWNRTGGADHFLVACHDWAAAETREYMNTCIRALCNSDVKSEGFELGKDVSLPETFVRSPKNPSRESGGKPPSKRPVLAFFAGQMHGYVRPILLQHWENKDPDMKIFGKLPKSKNNRNYVQYMKSSKYCICAKGYEVNSPRVVEAIFYECVPVIISDNFVPPFFEILNWESFAVFVLEKDIPNLKNILLSISQRRYLVMQQRVKQVQRHFLWHVKPEKYDLFHMILHSIWYNRVFTVNPR